MNEKADNINGLVEHQTLVRFSPKLAERVHREFMGVPEQQRPRLDITWNEREAVVRFGAKKYSGMLFDLPCITETYKMASKSRLFKSGDIGQVLVVYDPDDEDDAAFYQQQRHDPYSKTLLSGLTPPSTFAWTRIFKKQNRAPKVDFAKVEHDLGEVNVAGKEDVEVDFIHPRELDKLFLKPGQRLVVDGVPVEPIEGKSVGQIMMIKRQEQVERVKRQLDEQKRQRKEEKRRRKEAAAAGGEGAVKRAKSEAADSAAAHAVAVVPTGGAGAAAADNMPQWQRAIVLNTAVTKLEGEIARLNAELSAPGVSDEQAAQLRAQIEERKRAIAAAHVQ